MPEQLVEGHTVFVAIDLVPNATAEEEFAAAVAVLVRERFFRLQNFRFPGVLWFNDQYLVDPEQLHKRRVQERMPCTGAVIAVNRGDPVDIDPYGYPTLANATYIESYHITDPNEHFWDVDLWRTTSDTYAWSVALLNNAAGYDKPDDGKCRASAFSDMPCVRTSDDRCLDFLGIASAADPRHKRTGDHGMRYPCDGCSPLKYNAVLYFRLQHLYHANASKDHREGVGDDWWADVAGCHDSATNAWNCPDGDDDREGNSHPYNPELLFPAATYDGRDNHGGSDICQNSGELEDDCHATRDMDIYYGYVQDPPILRNYWLFETQGVDAPYHCHDDIAICGTEDFPT